MSLICQMLPVPRSRYYYQPVERDEESLKQAIRELAAAWPMYGYRRIMVELQRAAWPVNHKPVLRLMGEPGLLAADEARDD